MSKKQPKKLTIFISYSYQDKEWLDRLHPHLEYLKRNYDVEVWDNTKTVPGDEWLDDTRRFIEQARLAILLVSPDYLTSEYIYRHELPLLLASERKRGIVILPIIVRPSRIQGSEINLFYPVNNHSKPLSSLSSLEQDRVFKRLIERIIDILPGQQAFEDLEPPLVMPHPPPQAISFHPDVDVSKWAAILRNASIAVLVIGFIASLMWLMPRIGAPILRPTNINDSQTVLLAANLYGNGETQSAGGTISGILSIKVPKSSKVSATIPVSAQFKPDSEYVYILSTALKLESPSFKITQVNIPEMYSPRIMKPREELIWSWLILPEKTGRHALSLRFDPPVYYQLDQKRRPEDFEYNADSIVAFVTVLDDLGLTPTQDAILKSLGAIIAIAGTIFGYPFLRRYLESKDKST